MSFMKSIKTFFPLAFAAIMALMCLAANLQAQISVTASGSVPLTFDSIPPTNQFSMRNVAGGSGAPSPTDATTLGAAAVTNSARMIASALVSDGGNPPALNGNATWSSSGKYAHTRPTGNAFILLLATFRNDKGSPITSIDLGYKLTVAAPATEQVNGHLVYYSLSGDAGSWVPLPTISNQDNDNVAGTYNKATTLDLTATPWAAGSNLYIMWADDNGSGSPDTSLAIDDLALSFPGQPPHFTSVPANTNVTQCGTVSLSVQVIGSSPITLQWYHDNVAISGNPTATSSTLTISNAQSSDAGSYFARATNPFGTADSTPATTLTYQPDTTRPTMVKAVGLNDMVTIVVTFSEAMNDFAGDPFSVLICNKADANDCLGYQPGTFSADRTQVTFTTTPRTPGVNYEVQAFAPVADYCATNEIIDGSTIPVNTEVVLLTADDATQWRYNQEGVDLSATAWKTPGFVEDSTWGTGPAALAVEDTPPTDPALRTTLNRNNAIYPTDAIPTYYFRAHFNYPGDPTSPAAGLKLRTAFDDYGYVYINGTEVYRNPELGTVGSAELAFTAYTGGTAIGNYAWGSYVNIPLTSVVQGDNVVAVQVKQQATGSSDVGMAIELVAELPAIVEQCPSITTPPQSITVNEFNPATFTVTASGTSLQYEWQYNGTPITGANQRSYTIPSAHPSDNGPYRVRVFNTCSGVNSVLSAPATLTVTPKTSQPVVVSAVGQPGQTNILITFTNGPLSASSAQTLANYTVSGGVTVQSAVLQPDNESVLLTTTPRTPGQAYSLTVKDITDAAGTPHVLAPNPTTISPLVQKVLIVAKNATWKYLNTGANLDAVPWTTSGFNDSAWPSASALLGFETTAGTYTALRNEGWNTNNLSLLSRTNTTGGGLNGTNITDFFRTAVNIPFSLSGAVIEVNHAIDDGAVFYFNTNEVLRVNMPAGHIGYLTNAVAASAEGVTVTDSGLSGLVTGNNIIAVEVHQNTFSSSDIVFGAEVLAVYGATKPTLTIVNNGNGTVTISWTPSGGTLQQSTDLTTWASAPSQANPQNVSSTTGARFYRVAP